MGRHWVSIRDAISAGTLRSGDPKAASIADSWIALARNLALRFTAELGVSVKHVLPRRAVSDAIYRTELTVEELANDGTFTAALRIPYAAGQLTIIADMRTNKITCSTAVTAPRAARPGLHDRPPCGSMRCRRSRPRGRRHLLGGHSRQARNQDGCCRSARYSARSVVPPR